MNERDIFLAALEISNQEELSAYLDQACAGNAELRAQVQGLLEMHFETSQFLETPAAASESVIEQTIVTDSASEGHHGYVDNDSGEAIFRKYLRPSTRPGYLGCLGHYHIEEILGCGAFGIVAKGFDEKLHRVVAIKLMRPELASTSPPRKRFLREARATAAIPHENIVAIYAVEEDPIPYLVMEYVPGQTLQQRMDENGPLGTEEILRIGQQVALGLAAAHSANLIHRDIKPSNILLGNGSNARVKISDFGLARTVDDATLTSSGFIAGTPMYMAPEQARGEALDHRADLFSLGSVLYQMAGGRAPFRASNSVAVLKRVCEDTPRPLGDVLPGTPAWLERIIFKLLEKKRENRSQSAREVAEILAVCQREIEHLGQVTDAQELSRVIDAEASNAGALIAPVTLGGTRQRSALIVFMVAVASLGAAISWVLFQGMLNESTSPLANNLDPPSKTETITNTEDPKLIDPQYLDDRKYFGQLQRLGAVVSCWGLQSKLTEPLKTAMQDKGNDNWLLTDTTSLEGSSQLMQNGNVFVSFQDTSFGDDQLAEVARLAKRRPPGCPPINIQINSSSVTSDGVKALADTPMNSLTLVDIQLELDAIDSIAQNKPAGSLIIANGGLTDESVAKLLENSQFLWFHIPSNRITYKSLLRVNQSDVTILNIGDNGLEDEDLIPLAKNESITVLYLSGNPITDEGLQYLSDLPLTDLLLDRTQVTESGVQNFHERMPNCRIQWDNGKVFGVE